MIELNTIHNLDVLALLSALESKSVDLCWFDPPYNVGKDYGSTCNDNKSDEEYLAWVEKFLNEAKRVGKGVCVFVPTKYKREYWNILGEGFQEVILTYSPRGGIRYGFSNQFSTLLTNSKPVKLIENVWHNCQYSGLGYFFREETYGHPGYTSEDITGRVLDGFTNENDVVCDPFFGTGTTGVIAERYGRRWIGGEINPTYVALANKRIEIERRQERMFKPAQVSGAQGALALDE